MLLLYKHQTEWNIKNWSWLPAGSLFPPLARRRVHGFASRCDWFSDCLLALWLARITLVFVWQHKGGGGGGSSIHRVMIFRLKSRRHRTFAVVPKENFRDQCHVWSPVFLPGTFHMENRVPFHQVAVFRKTWLICVRGNTIPRQNFISPEFRLPFAQKVIRRVFPRKWQSTPDEKHLGKTNDAKITWKQTFSIV